MAREWAHKNEHIFPSTLASNIGCSFHFYAVLHTWRIEILNKPAEIEPAYESSFYIHADLIAQHVFAHLINDQFKQ